MDLFILMVAKKDVVVKTLTSTVSVDGYNHLNATVDSNVVALSNDRNYHTESNHGFTMT